MEQLLEGAPWWVLIVLLVLGVGVPAGGSQKAATLPGLLGSGARWWQARKERHRAEMRAQAAAAAELSPSERISDKEIARLELRYEDLAEDCREDARRAEAAYEALASRVDDLEEKVTAWSRQFFSLLGHHRRTVTALESGKSKPPVPEELRQYLA